MKRGNETGYIKGAKTRKKVTEYDGMLGTIQQYRHHTPTTAQPLPPGYSGGTRRTACAGSHQIAG